MRLLFCILIFFSIPAYAQIKPSAKVNTVTVEDTLVVNSGKKDSLKIFVPTIKDYQYYTQYSGKKIFDTLLTADKSYSFTQYTNTDNFGKLQFANIGSGYNPLAYEWNNKGNLSLMPTNKSWGILTADQIKYYDVKTPTTAFVFHNGVNNGAALYSTYTQNIGKRFNFAIDYYGLRSQGNYQNSLAVNNNTTFSAHYISKQGQYELFAHYIHQNITNQENGGITAEYDEYYQSGNKEINNRQTIPVIFSNSYSRFAYRRYYLSHQFSPFNVEKFPFKIKHTLQHQGNKYYYEMGNVDTQQFQDIVPNQWLSSKKYSENLSNTLSLLLDAPQLKLEAGVQHQWLQLGSNPLVLNGISMQKEYKENRLGIIANAQYHFSDVLSIRSALDISRGAELGNFIHSENTVYYQPLKDFFVASHVHYRSSVPSFNLLLNTSPSYLYNYNFSNFKNEKIVNIGGTLGLKWGNTRLSAQYFRIDQFAYLDALAQPKQTTESVSLSQISGDTTLNYGDFNLNTKLLFQQNMTGNEYLPLPKFIGRANLYYLSRAFNGKAEIQTGIKVYYFSKFNSRDYAPILNEFILPGSQSFSIGGQPIADAYFNLKVKKMFIFIEGQHFNTLVSPNKVYTAPHFPFYDFRINLGIVWYLFS